MTAKEQTKNKNREMDLSYEPVLTDVKRNVDIKKLNSEGRRDTGGWKTEI